MLVWKSDHSQMDIECLAKNTLLRRLRTAVGFCKDAPVVLQTDSDRSVSEVTTGRGDPASKDQRRTGELKMDDNG